MNEARPSRVLVVEDEPNIAAGLKLNFELEGYDVTVAATARQAANAMLDREGYDVVVLDVMLPDLDGFELCRRLREADNLTPILMLTARGDPEDRVRGLEVGADDYLAKPFDLAELLARVRSLLRRRHWEQRGGGDPAVLRFGAIVIDLGAATVTRDGEPLKLTKLEFDLLVYFVTHAGEVLSRERLQREVWKLGGYTRSRMVDNFVMRLRRLIELDPAQPRHLVSMRGWGYKFEPDGADPAGPREG